MYVRMDVAVKGLSQLLFLRHLPLNFSDWLACESQAFPFSASSVLGLRCIQLDHFLFLCGFGD